MRWSDVPLNPPERTLRQFAGLWTAVFAVLACRQGWLSAPGPAALVLVLLGLGGGALGLLWPRAVRPIFVGAVVVTFPIGWAVSHLVLAVLFYAVFTPLGLLFRLLGRDVLCRRP